MITFQNVLDNKELSACVAYGNDVLGILGYTDHSKVHTLKVGDVASSILKKFGYSEREQELAKIASYVHDIGNVIGRKGHAQTGANMAFYLLHQMGMDISEVCLCASAVGNHDEDSGLPVSAVAAALIIGDKTDVRRSRVRNRDFVTFDIHDRVNYAVTKNELHINGEHRIITLDLSIDTEICPVLDYFEIFLARMVLCKRASEFLNSKFEIIANESRIL